MSRQLSLSATIVILTMSAFAISVSKGEPGTQHSDIPSPFNAVTALSH